MGISLSVAATRAGLSKKSSAYRGYLQQARDSGLIKERADGKFVAVNPPDGPIQKHTIETWKPRLTPSCASMLQVIHDAEQPLTKDIVAELAGISPTSSGLGSGLHKLVQLDLIEFMESDKTYMIGEAFR